MKERIQKLLSHAGYGSRREIERWIASGEVMVNGKPATIGQQISAQDQVAIRGQKLYLASRVNATPKTLIYHKRVGEVCTRSDPERRPTVFQSLPRLRQGRWVMVGRLDVNTDGLLLFTTDGELANKLMHPSSEVEREYSVRILGEVTDAMLKQLKEGVELEDGPAHFNSIRDAGGEGANHWYYVTLSEGRNREVRRMWEAFGVTVSRLVRIRYGNVSLPRHLRQGQHEELDVKTLRKLYESVDLKFENGALTERRPRQERDSGRRRSSGRPTARRGSNQRPAPRGGKQRAPKRR